MSTGLAYNKYDKGGLCYAACQEAFEWYALYLFDWYINIGGTLLLSGARRAAILPEAEIQTHFSGMSIKEFLFIANFFRVWLLNWSIIICREEADNMCKMMAASCYSL